MHFGHQTRRWHPKMRRYIFGERDGIYIIDLMQTVELLERARAFAEDLASAGGVILFVGTKKQAKDTIKEVAEDGRHALRERALARRPADELQHDEAADRPAARAAASCHDEGRLELLPTKERMSMEAELHEARDEPQRRRATCSTSRTRSS